MIDEFNRKNEYQKSQMQDESPIKEYVPAHDELGRIIDEYHDEAPELIDPEEL